MVGESNARFEQDGTIKFEINEHTLFTSNLSRFFFIGIWFLRQYSEAMENLKFSKITVSAEDQGHSYSAKAV